MTVPEAMQDRQLRRFQLSRRRLSVAGGSLSMVVPRALDRSFWSQHLAAFARGEQPYWAEIWPAAVGVARLLMRGGSLRGQRAVDLGCGLGLAGTAAACRGADVLLVDRDPDALRFARFNAAHNVAAFGAAGAPRAPGVLCHDWHGSPVPGSFDLALLADVTYCETDHQALLAQLGSCMRPGGRALHADPFRDESTRFLERAAREYRIAAFATDVHHEGQRLRLRLAWIDRAR
jgi:predicted nicotinamide N-methyase